MSDLQRNSSMTKHHPRTDNLTPRKRLRTALSGVSPFNLMENLNSVASFPAKPCNSLKSTKKTSKSKSVKKAMYKHIPHSEKPAHLVAKRNERERNRVQAVNSAFLQLRKHVPHEPKHKRLSKFKTLKVAIQYIRHLQDMIQSHDDKMAGENRRSTTRGGQHQHNSITNVNNVNPPRTFHRTSRSSLPILLSSYINNSLSSNDIGIDYDPHVYEHSSSSSAGVVFYNTPGTESQGRIHNPRNFPYGMDHVPCNENSSHQSHDSKSKAREDIIHNVDFSALHNLLPTGNDYDRCGTNSITQETIETFLEGSWPPIDYPMAPRHTLTNQWHPHQDNNNFSYNNASAITPALTFSDTRSHSATPDSVTSSIDSSINNNSSGILSCSINSSGSSKTTVAYSPFQDSAAGVRGGDHQQQLSDGTSFSTQ